VGGEVFDVDLHPGSVGSEQVDPVTLVRNPVILRAIARDRDARVGVYGTTVEPGRVAVGDPVELER
jgi:uncharacterized protein